MKTAGIVVVILGIVLTIYTSITVFTKKTIVNVGPLNVSKEEPHTAYWSPLLGIAVIGVGALLLWQGNKKS